MSGRGDGGVALPARRILTAVAVILAALEGLPSGLNEERRAGVELKPGEVLGDAPPV